MNRGSWKSTAKSHKGSVRPLNEDAFLNQPDAALWCVADGMGGHSKGDVASGIIVQKLSELIANSDELSTDSIQTAIEAANTEIVSLSRQLKETIGSTVAVLFVADDIAHIFWAGDSRIYHFTDNKLVQVTQDHNQAGELVKYGMLTPERAKRHPGANLLTRAVGINSSLRLDHKSLAWKESDKFILCTDGLNSVMENVAINAHFIVTESKDWSESLINQALDNWALDNITAVTVHCDNALG
jgi:protein phosphatase